MPKEKNNVVKKPLLNENKCYCRKCQKSMSSDNFYEATNPYLDSNGKMSICKSCSNEIYQKYFEIYGSMDKALYYTCRDLDVSYNKEALNQTQSHIEKLVSNGKKAEAVFGYYKSKLSSIGKKSGKVDSFRFKDSDNCQQKTDNDKLVDIENDMLIDDELILFWGKGFDVDDIIFLEKELSNWKQTHKCDNQAEITLLKEICIKILTIRNKREIKENTSNDVKELQDLFKTASVDPAKANAASAGKSLDSFGVWVKDIEQFRPAEWFEKQEKYVDMDGFKPYINNYIKRPIENFLTGVRNFFVDDNIDGDLSESDETNDGDSNG